ncbi:MAG: hypothetical protein ATN35_10160 [Epulopiscium sp. Nele67-Bin004]|nr:MAG: hypothetical protein ATN35_10160 [Epulopiscium sp. Nele67-Bin004]
MQKDSKDKSKVIPINVTSEKTSTQSTQREKVKKSIKPDYKKNLPAFIMGAVALLLVVYIGYTAYIESTRELVYLEVDSVIYEFNPLRMEHVCVNEDQVVYISEDGIVALDKRGNEVWSSIHSLDNIIVAQTEPYLAIGAVGEKTITIYSDKGKRGEILLQNPIVTFSINENGTVAVIQQLENGHLVSAYDSNGRFLEVSSGSFVSNGDYPVAATVSPDDSLIMISYLYVGGVEVASNVGAISMNKPQTETYEPMLYGSIEENNLVYDIQFIDNDTWVSIGDKYITFYDTDGTKLRRVSVSGVIFYPTADAAPTIGGYLPIVTGNWTVGNTVHSNSKLTLMKQDTDITVDLDFDLQLKFFNSNSKGTIVGDGRNFKGYNKVGTQYFEYHATQDVSQVLAADGFYVAITSDSIVRLKTKSSEAD